MSIDWKRIAKPQPDGYDSEVIASILYEKYGWKKIAPSTELTLCNGAVGITEDKLVLLGRSSKYGPMQDGMSYMTPELATKIDRFLMAWPDGSLMLQNFLDEYWAKWSENMSPQARGCSSGHTVMSDNLRYQTTEEKLILNAVYVTANDPQGCCEGTYHEVGHARLESIGIDIDKHDNQLLLNTPDELYDSPVRWDVKRPMSAVVQAVYSWIMLSEVDLQCGLNLTGWDTKDPLVQVSPADASAIYLIANIPKIQDGLVEIRTHAKLTPAGMAFMDGYLEWGEDLISRALPFLKETLGDRFDTEYARALDYRSRRLLELQANEDAKRANQAAVTP